MKEQSYRLVKSDSNDEKTMEIATYHTPGVSGCQYVICKNSKRIGWGSTEHNALQIHDMYVRIHILHEDNSAPDDDTKIEAMPSVPKNNGFLHDLPEEVEAERKKQIWW